MRTALAVSLAVASLTVIAATALGDATPAIVPAQGSPVAAGSSPYAVAFSQGGALLAAANYVSGTVSIFSVNYATGGVTPAASPVATDRGPDALAFSPSGGLLATADLINNDVSVFSVNASSGAVTEIPGSPFPTGGQPRSVAFGPGGGLLATANYVDNSVSVFSVDPGSGALTQVPGSPFAAGSQPRSVAFSPSGGLLAVANGGDNTVSLFSVGASGALTNVAGSPFATGTEPSALAFSPSGGLLAVTNAGDNTVSEFTVGRSAGGLAPVTGSPFATGARPSAVAFSAGGSLLATANYAESDASVFSVDAASGALSQVPGSPFATGSLPHGIALSPTGVLLATANPGDGTLSMFTLAPPTAVIGSPGPGGTYKQGQAVPTTFSCADSGFGPGIASCTDGGGAVGGSGQLDTTTAGGHAYTVTAKSSDGLSSAATITYTVLPGPPVSTKQPELDGFPAVGQDLTCWAGSWSNSPQSYSYEWFRNGVPIGGAGRPVYTVRPLDAGSTVSCAVTASNSAGVGLPSFSRQLRVWVPFVQGCPAATGGISGATLGLARLGATRAQVRRAYRRSTIHSGDYTDTFCLTPVGVTVGYPTPALLGALPPAERRHLRGRVVWIRSSNPRYAVAGVRLGAGVDGAEQRLHGTLLRVGANAVYLAPDGPAIAVIEASHGIVQAVGIVDGNAVRSRKAERLLLRSFS